LSNLGFSDYNQYENHLAEYRRIVETLKEVSNKLEAILPDKDWQNFVDENINFDIQMNARLKELDSLLSFKLEPCHYRIWKTQ